MAKKPTCPTNDRNTHRRSRNAPIIVVLRNMLRRHFEIRGQRRKNSGNPAIPHPRSNSVIFITVIEILKVDCENVDSLEFDPHFLKRVCAKFGDYLC